jgi:uncharacterized protein (TIGR03437 family)
MNKTAKSLAAIAIVCLACAATASAQVTLSVNKSSLSLSSLPGGAPVGEIVDLTSTTSVAFTAAAATASGGNWLSVGPTGLTTPAKLFVIASPLLLTSGTYSGSITITAAGAANSPLVVQVTFTVGVSGSTLTTNPASLSFDFVSGGATPLPKFLQVSSTSGAPLNFTAAASTASGVAWLTINPTVSTTPVNLTVSVNPAGLALGTHAGTITLTPVGVIGGSLQVQVTLNVTGTPQLTATPNVVTFYYQLGGTAPPQQTVSLASGGIPLVFTATPGTTSGGNWLVLSPTFGGTPSDLTIAVNSSVLSALAAGSYSGTVTIAAQGASNSPLTVPVTLLVGINPFLLSNPAALSFEVQPGGTVPPGKTLTVTSTGSALPFQVAVSTTTTGVAWLTATPAGGLTPATITVGLAAAALSLQPGTYTGTVVLTPTVAGVPQVNVGVTLTVTNTPILILKPGSLSFNYQIGRIPPAIQTVDLTSTGVPVNFTAQVSQASGGNWLSISTTSGVTPATLSVSANPAGMTAGTYQGSVTFTPVGGGNGQTLQVTFNVSNTALLNLSRGTLSFDFVLGSTALKTADLGLTSTGDALNFTVTWTTTSGGANWLAVTPPSGATPSNLTIIANPSGLPVGTFNGSITATATGANSQTIPVTVTVTSGITISTSPAELAFSQTQGGAAPDPKTVSLTSTGGSVAFTATASTAFAGNWLSVTPTSGNTNATLNVSVNGAGLSPGIYNGIVTIVSTAASNSPQSVRVTFTVGQPQTIAVSPGSLSFDYQIGSAAPAAKKLTLTSTGGSLNFSATAATGSGGSWLGVAPVSGATGASGQGNELNVTVSPASLNAGAYTGTITISSTSASNSPQTVNVTLTVTVAPLPTPVIASVANAASYVRGGVCAGEIVYFEGTNIGPPTLTTLRVTGGRVDTLLAGTRVLFDGVASPLIYVSSTKTSAVVPYGVGGRVSTRVQVEYQGVRSDAIEFRVVDSQPGIFTIDASGRGPGAILNQNFSLNSNANPASRGAYVMIYATGEGLVTPAVADGSVSPGAEPFPRPLLPVTVTIGGKQAQQVAYAGAAPGFVAGVLQLNVRVPDDLVVSGVTVVPVVVTVGVASSQPNVTLAVQ